MLIRSGLGFVTSVLRNLKHGVIPRFEQSGAELHAATRDIGEWSLAEQPGKPFCKYGA
jgi:hypothetical protein